MTTTAEREARYQRIVRDRDVLAGRIEAARAERHRLEDQMHEYGASSLEEMRRMVVDDQLTLVQVESHFDASCDRAEAVLEAAPK